MDDDPVLLAPAYRWTCPDCGWLNFATPMPVEFTVAELATIKRQLSTRARQTVSPPSDRTIVAPPEVVTCLACQLEFTATDGTDQ